VITCRKCAKENQDHYKFCLGCGAELPREQGPKPFSAQTPSHGVKPIATGVPPAPAAGSQQQVSNKAAMAATALVSSLPTPGAGGSGQFTSATAPPMAATYAVQPPPAATPIAPTVEAGGASINCPQCNQANPRSNRFCAACGYNLSAAAQMIPSAPPMAQPAATATMKPIMMVALRADGSESGNFLLPEAVQVTVGRDTGSIFAGDSYLSPRHATITRRGNDIVVRDAGSLNGVYLKLRPHEPWSLDFGDVFRIGQEIVRFEELVQQPATPDGVKRFGSPAKGYIGRLALVIGRDTTGNAFPVPERGVHCGRERGDILFSEDGYVSGLHCRIGKSSDGLTTLMDVGSSNGTFIRLKTEHTLISGDVLLMGQQLFRVDF
jgi:pSer/pThr/pTyr-binding forkhead associated (FHA) protein